MESGQFKHGKHVLILEGNCKQSLPFIRGFKQLGCEVSVLCGSRLDCAYASRLPDHKILGVCDYSKPLASENYIVQLIRSGSYDLVFPVFDFSARILAKHKKELSDYAVIYANDYDAFERAYDKNTVMRKCMESGIPCPTTIFHAQSPEDILNAGIRFPIIMKPRRMYGARGFHRFNSPDEMREYMKEHSPDLTDCVIQEFIPEGSELCCAVIFIDRDGEIKSSYSYISEHVYPKYGGTSTLNGVIDRPDAQEYCERLGKQMGLRGIIGVDYMIDRRDQQCKILEINVRAVHGIAIGFFFGVDHARQVYEDAFGLPVTKMKINKTDTAVRILQTDMLWFLSSKDRLQKMPKKLGYRRTKEQMFFADDPLPWFSYLINGLWTFKKKMREKRQ